MADQNFYLDKVKNNIHARILISHGTSEIFQGMVRNDLTISIGSQYQSLFKVQSLDNASSILNQSMFIASSLGATDGTTNFQLKTPALTSLIWMGTESPVFTIPLTIVAWRKNQNILTVLKSLYKTVLPTTKDGDITQIMYAPLGYTANSANNDNIPTNTLTVKIGTWFTATNLVMTNVSFDIARVASSKDGNPLYADGAISFRPYRDITYNQFSEFLSKSKG